ncbi:MAG: PBECR4 domain-containing protein [Blautia sp.]|nr:PBECR4 domain-containing protein [Lachnoclostridium sp.]MCM1211949.1 PBECR4 domain-containing protein [Blautia sp.]
MKPQTGVGCKAERKCSNRLAYAGRLSFGKEYTMDKLSACANAYHKMLNLTYQIVLGRKGKLYELHIGFEAVSFHHLIGIHKLHDLRIARANREKVFSDILAGKISYEFISKSRYFTQIENRFFPFASIEKIFDDNSLVFRYNAKVNQLSLIEADYLMSTPYEGNDIYIFLARKQDDDHYYCRSFFPKSERDYTQGQPRFTLLKKEKTCLSTGKTTVQYDQLTPKG